jgi:hypothetical protein
MYLTTGIVTASSREVSASAVPPPSLGGAEGAPTEYVYPPATGWLSAEMTR